MKRLLLKFWDNTNGKLTTYYYKVYDSCIMLECIFESYSPCKSPEAACHLSRRMFAQVHFGYYGKRHLELLHKYRNIKRNRKVNIS